MKNGFGFAPKRYVTLLVTIVPPLRNYDVALGTMPLTNDDRTGSN